MNMVFDKFPTSNITFADYKQSHVKRINLVSKRVRKSRQFVKTVTILYSYSTSLDESTNIHECNSYCTLIAVEMVQ